MSTDAKAATPNAYGRNIRRAGTRSILVGKGAPEVPQAEADAAVAAYLAKGGAVTRCPTMYVAPAETFAGRHAIVPGARVQISASA